MSQITDSARIYPNVELGKDVQVGSWAVIGLPPQGVAPGELRTTIASGSVIRSHTVIYAGSQIGPKFQTGHHAVIGPGMDISANCSIGTSSYVAGFVKLSSKARVHGHSYIGEFVSIEEQAWVGPYNIVEGNVDKITVIGRGAILGMSAQLYGGVRIGDRALISMRCIVEQDVVPYRVMVGNPPRAVRTIDAVVSPNPAIGRPYEADPEEIQKVAFARHAARAGCTIDAGDWRLAVWELVQSARKANQHRHIRVGSAEIVEREVVTPLSI
jgi:acyl-[acyl carrier protein]--UDP-N-acetylglucosamine O-acyltransferase